MREEISNTVREAERLASQEKFSEALRTVTRGYILDPTNSDLQACENRIATAQAEWTERVQRERQEQEEALRKKLEEEEERRKTEERERLVRAEQERQEEQKREMQHQIVRHLRKAHEHLVANKFREAREEVAAAFVLDPFSEDVAMLERRIAEEQARAAQPRSEPVPNTPEQQGEGGAGTYTDAGGQTTGTGVEANPAIGPVADASPAAGSGDASDTREAVEAVEAVIARTLADAKRYSTEGRFEQALQETALAIALDPANDMIRRFEAGIRRDWDEHRRIARERKNAESQRNRGDSGTSQPPGSQTAPARTDEPSTRPSQKPERLNPEPHGQETMTAAPDRTELPGSRAGSATETTPEAPPQKAAEEIGRKFDGWRRRAILAAAIVSALLLFVFYELTPPVPVVRPPGTGAATQSANQTNSPPAESRLQ